MKKTLLILSILLSASLFAQDTVIETKYWKITGFNSVNLNQVALSNWQAGGASSLSGNIVLKWYANYKKDKVSWDNNVNLMYGLYKEKNKAVEKNEDLIDLNSIFGYQATKKWQYALLFNFKSQFAPGYDEDYDSVKISNFMAPGYLTLSAGMRYQPVDWFYIFLSPITIKSTFVVDQELADIGAFGVDPAVYDSISGEWVKTQDGSNSIFRYGAFGEVYLGKEIAKGLALESKFNAFYSYNDRGNLKALDMDINWATFLNYKLKDWLSMSLFVNLVYLPGQASVEVDIIDGVPTPETGPSNLVQIKETFGIGITYNFANFVEEK